MKLDEKIRVQLGSYISNMRLMAPNLLHINRTHFRKKEEIEMDAFGCFWSLALAEIKTGQIGVRCNGEIIQRDGRRMAFLPRYSIVEWVLKRGTYQFEAVLSTADLPPDMPRKAVSFLFSGNAFPKTVDEIIDCVMSSQWDTIERCDTLTPVAARTKHMIDREYQEPLSIVDAATRLKVPYAVMQRAFRRSYGMAPVAYRNRIRLMEALRLLILNETNIANIGLQSGFQDVSRFNKQFKKFTKGTPSQFL